MKAKIFATAAALIIAAPGLVLAQQLQQIDNVPINQFALCDAVKFMCDDRSNPVSDKEENIRHNISKVTGIRMIYKVGSRPQPQEFVLVSEVYDRVSRPVIEPVKRNVLVQPLEIGVPWAYVPPKQ
jgi:hypothetical protein